MTQLPEVTAVVERAVRTSAVPGAVVRVVSEGRTVHTSAHGVYDAETAYPLREDTVFWLASLSKAIGAAAVLALADEGRLDLADPVSAYVPQFGAPGRVRVLRPGSPSPFGLPFGPPPDPLPEFDVVPAERELTLFDLLTHTGGLQSLLLYNPEFAPPAPGQALAEYVPTLGGLVRDFQAGQGWAYSNAASFDVLSRVVEVVSGQPLDVFLGARLFGPLGMRSTGFGRAGQEGAMPVPPMFAHDPVVTGTMPTTSAGLWASPEDYLVFAELLRNGGEHRGVRLLDRTSVERMTTNQIGDLCPGLNGRGDARGIGFGLAVAVMEDPAAAGEAVPARTFGWDGVGTRRFWVSPDAGWSLFMYAPDVTVQRDIEAAVTAALG